MLYIYHHLGLGDHFICNGLVREIIKKNEFDTYILFVKNRNYVTIKNMYLDIKNLDFYIVDDNNGDVEIRNMLEHNKNNIVVGYFANFWGSNFSKTMDENFYKQANVSHDCRWTSFKINRNLDNEQKLYDKYNITSEYIFIHDDDDRKIKTFRKDLQIIKPINNITDNVLDYMKIIENATEIHCIDSSFKSLIESIDVNGKLFFHQYASQVYKLYKGEWGLPLIKKNWIIL